MKTTVLAISAATLILQCGTAMGQTTTTTTTKEQKSTETRPPETKQAMKHDKQYQRLELIPAAWVMDAKVRGQNNEHIAEVEDLIVAVEKGKVHYVLIEQSALDDIRDEVIAVPWQSVRWDPSKKELIISATSDQLDNAPKFDADQWHLLGEKSWRDRIGSYFSTGDGEDDHAVGGNGWVGRSDYQALISKGQPVSFSGTIEEIDTREPMPGMGDAYILRIQAADGRERYVHVGPEWFVENQGRLFHEGDQIDVRGTQLTLDNKDVVAAHRISGPGGTLTLRDQQGKPVWDLVGDAEPEVRMTESDQPDTKHPEDKNPDRPEDAIAMSGKLIKASKFKDQDLKDSSGKQLGEIETFVFDTNSGRAAFVVVEAGGFMGMGEDKLVVPWSMFSINKEGRLEAQQLTETSLREAPRVSSKDWDELQDPQFYRQVAQVFGQDVWWIEKAGARLTAAVDMEQQIQQAFRQGAPAELSGTVVRLQAAPDYPQLTQIVLRTDDGERVIYVAPKSYLDKAKISFNEGERVAVKGRNALINGKQCLIASEVELDGRTASVRQDDGTPEWK